MSKIITDELINERLEAKGFGDKQACDDDIVRENVLKHFNVELTDQFTENADYYIYEETTNDGYSVYVATDDPNKISVCEDIHYYDSGLSSVLEEQLKCSNGDEDWPEVIYVDDLYQDFIDGTMQDLFMYLYRRFEEEVINELIEEGYEQND
jgi:hypothetical protein